MALTYADALTFVQNLAPTWVKPQHSMLAQLLRAMAERPSLCPTELARALTDGSPARSEQSLHGRLKRLNRFLDIGGRSPARKWGTASGNTPCASLLLLIQSAIESGAKYPYPTPPQIPVHPTPTTALEGGGT